MDSSNRHEKPSIPFNFLKKSLPILLSLSCIGCVNEVDTHTPQQSNYQQAPTAEQIAKKQIRILKYEGYKPFTTTSDGLAVTLSEQGIFLNGTNVNTLATNPCDVLALKNQGLSEIEITSADIELLGAKLEDIQGVKINGFKIDLNSVKVDFEKQNLTRAVIFVSKGDFKIKNFDNGTLVVTGGTINITNLGQDAKLIERGGTVNVENNKGIHFKNRS